MWLLCVSKTYAVVAKTAHAAAKAVSFMVRFGGCACLERASGSTYAWGLQNVLQEVFGLLAFASIGEAT
eukprot:17545-Heterococcus_DN1.PRE.4